MATTDSFIQLPADGSGKKIDNSQIASDGGNTVYRQRVNLSDPADPDAHAAVVNRDPTASDYALAKASYNEGQIVVLLQQILLELQEFKSVLYSKIS